MKKQWAIIVAVLISMLGMISAIFFWLYNPFANLPLPISILPNQIRNNNLSQNQYPIHRNITVTTFWVGESASLNNSFISNSSSAWDENWQSHYGGTDTPDNRNGFYPADFVPKENPFYFALPYNDFDADGKRKENVSAIIYWSKENTWNQSQSMLKNQWIRITKGGKSAYAQWEDVGPYGEDDSAYVFGNSAPDNRDNNNAGLDVSPAVRDFLILDGEEKVDWQFIKEADVPTGPWKDIITSS